MRKNSLKNTKKLRLSTETLRQLNVTELKGVYGGAGPATSEWESCSCGPN